ncbi:MAG: hypothetical protein ACI35O_13525 [Bacillaceae bacterium]
MSWKKKGLLMTSILALSFSLIACGNSEKAGNSGGDSGKGKTLSLLTWEGYADPSFTKAVF